MSSRLYPGLIAAILAAAPTYAVAKTKSLVGQPAPPFEATTIDKQKLSLDALKGQVVVLNYWATWCVPCKAEMPMFDTFYRRYKGSGFTLIGITTEDSVPNYMLKKLDAALAYPLAAKFKARGYGIMGGVPTTYVIDRRGIIRYAKADSVNEAEFNALILPLLLEKAQ